MQIIKGGIKMDSKNKVKKEDFVVKIKKKNLLIILAVIVIIAIFFTVKPYLQKNNISVADSSDIIVLNDIRCKECDVIGVITQLKSTFPNLVVGEIDYMDEEGKKIYGESDLAALPAILFKDNVKDNANYAQVENYLDQKGDFLSLRIGANFDPTKEICDNGIDDTANNLIDCEDDDCKGSLKCREEKKNNLQVFIMSDCPYGRKAGEALKEIVDNFGDLIDYEVHYIASEQGDGFSSLHGQYEVDEDIMQLCVKEYNPAKFLDYLYCRSTKGVKDKDWKECGNEIGVDIDNVQVCFDGSQGKELLRNDIKIAQDLGVTGSPTWLANNRYKFGGIDAESVKKNFCTYNSELSGCEKTLSNSTSTSGSCG